MPLAIRQALREDIPRLCHLMKELSGHEISQEEMNNRLEFIEEGKMPDIFLIPAKVWENPNEMFVDRNYDKPGQKSAPEYGINISQKNYPILEIFRFEDSIKEFIEIKN